MNPLSLLTNRRSGKNGPTNPQAHCGMNGSRLEPLPLEPGLPAPALLNTLEELSSTEHSVHSKYSEGPSIAAMPTLFEENRQTLRIFMRECIKFWTQQNV